MGKNRIKFEINNKSKCDNDNTNNSLKRGSNWGKCLGPWDFFSCFLQERSPRWGVFGSLFWVAGHFFSFTPFHYLDQIHKHRLLNANCFPLYVKMYFGNKQQKSNLCNVSFNFDFTFLVTPRPDRVTSRIHSPFSGHFLRTKKNPIF